MARGLLRLDSPTAQTLVADTTATAASCPPMTGPPAAAAALAAALPGRVSASAPGPAEAPVPAAPHDINVTATTAHPTPVTGTCRHAIPRRPPNLPTSPSLRGHTGARPKHYLHVIFREGRRAQGGRLVPMRSIAADKPAGATARPALSGPSPA